MWLRGVRKTFLYWQENKNILLSHMCKMKQPINIYLAKKEYFYLLALPTHPKFYVDCNIYEYCKGADGEHSAKHRVWLTRRHCSFNNGISNSAQPEFAHVSGAHTGNAQRPSKSFNIVTFVSSAGWHNRSHSTNVILTLSVDTKINCSGKAVPRRDACLLCLT